MKDKNSPKIRGVIQGAEQLSLGISIVVSILFGVGIGYLLKKWTGYDWIFWVGVFWGVGGAILNVYKAYKKQKASLDELKDRYKNYKPTYDEDDD